MSTPFDMPPETIVTELTLAVGQLLRRLRAETNPDGLTWSQTTALARTRRAGCQ
ncbi:hypothetical protein [Pleomorphomonas sp. PLEO]|uniref:hypothetical protein n=1 Tax=Pleomorphomonas sp. PLEO TaxID=3239306 RepID=UPI00351DEA4C